MELENYRKCKRCNADMSFDPATGKLSCKHCGKTEWIHRDYKVDLKPVEERPMNELQKGSRQHDFMIEKRKIICKNCGGEVEYSITDNTFICPYCASQLVSDDEVKDILRPDGVVIFRVKEKEARAAFNSWITKSLYYPTALKHAARQSEIKGIYVPVWTYDVPVSVRCTGTYVEGKGKDKHTVDFDEVVQLNIDDRIAVATDKYDFSRMKEIEPFKTDRNKPYRADYVVGFESDLQTIPIERAWKQEEPIAEEEMKKKGERQVKVRLYGNKDIKINSTSCEFGKITCKHLFVPVWMSEFEYKGNEYYYLVNGESGAVTGEMPVSYKKLYCMIAAGIIAAIVLLKYAKILLLILLVLFIVLAIAAWIIWRMIVEYIKERIDNPLE